MATRHIKTMSEEMPQMAHNITVGVQTEYRENEAQTDPFTCDYVLKPGHTASELLSLSTLTIGNGLPAGPAELEMIQWARTKRALRAALPPPDDLTQLEKRRRMMYDIEVRQWDFRKDQIERFQGPRLVALKERQRQSDDVQTSTNERLNLTLKHQNREANQLKIHRKYITSLRRITTRRRNLEGILKGGENVQNNAEYGENANVPKGVSCKNLEGYEGLSDLESDVSTIATRSQVSKCAIVPPENKEIEMLRMISALKEEKERAKKKRPLNFFIKIEKPPPTPRVVVPAEGEEERELSFIFLQKQLRGRSTQYMMRQGKASNLCLIEELIIAYPQYPWGPDEGYTSIQEKQKQLEDKTMQEESLQAMVVDAEVGYMFDTLNKELIRLQEEQRIRAFTQLAQREFCVRNAAESGRRQVEEHRRKEEDEIFKRVIPIHQDTVDCFIEDIIDETIETTADVQARNEIQKMARDTSELVWQNLQPEETVSKLVYSFLVPEEQRTILRERVQETHRKHLQVAWHIILGRPNPTHLLSLCGDTPTDDQDSSHIPDSWTT